MAADLPQELDAIQHPKKRAFLMAFSQHGVRSLACKEIGVDRSTEWLWRKQDPEFLAACEVAEQLAVEALEDAARDMAVNDRHPTMVIFLLKSYRPDVYNRAPVSNDKQKDERGFEGFTIVAEPEPDDDRD